MNYFLCYHKYIKVHNNKKNHHKIPLDSAKKLSNRSHARLIVNVILVLTHSEHYRLTSMTNDTALLIQRISAMGIELPLIKVMAGRKTSELFLSVETPSTLL